jgi:SAM-dependent methyltransferase
MDREPSLLQGVERYYSGRFAEFGATARGVDWNSEASQELRFAQLLRLLESDAPFSINDYGCGYGALVPYLDRRFGSFTYTGFDLSEAMISYARDQAGGRVGVGFVASGDELPVADFSVASGIFNVSLGVDRDEWTQYVLERIDRLDELSTAGFAFNMLTSYSEPEKMRDDLYYGDPAFFFEHCKRRHSPHVALLHDYGLWEFTVLVRKELP